MEIQAGAVFGSLDQRDVCEGATVAIKLSQWLANEKELAARELTGVVLRRTAKAVLVKAHAAVEPSDNCHHCGREIRHPGSRQIGYGPICSAKLGYPWKDRDELSAAEIEAIRAAIRVQTEVETWVPLKYVTGVVLAPVAPTIEPKTEPKPEVTPVIEPKTEVAPVDVTIRVETVDTRKNAGTFIVVRSTYSADHYERCKSVPGGRWDGEIPALNGGKPGAWVYAATPTTALLVKAAWEGKTRRGNAAFLDLIAAGDPAAIARADAAKHADDLADIPGLKGESWKHQRQAYHFSREKRAAMLSMAMGTGKSRVVVGLILNRHHDRTLILAPKTVCQSVWSGQFEAHADRPVVVHVAVGGSATASDRAKKAEKAMNGAAASGTPFVLVLNYESAYRDGMSEFLMKAHFDCVVFDESHKIKAPAGVGSRFCSRLAARIPWRIALTGTPMPHSPLDVYAQYRALDTALFGTNFQQFKARYSISDVFGNPYKYVNQDELNDKFYRIAYRVTADVLDLPPVQHITIPCKLGAEALRAYTALDDDFIAQVEAGEITVSNALVKLLRMSQITSGYLPTDDGVVVEVDASKREALREIFDGLDQKEPVVVICRFIHDLEAVEAACAADKELPRRYAELSGRNRKDTPGLEAWKAGEADVLAVQIQSGGVGIDLTRAHYCVYYSLGFNLGDYEQSLARTDRPGQTESVRYYHLIATGTVDERVYRALSEKKNVVEAILAEVRGSSERAKAALTA